MGPAPEQGGRPDDELAKLHGPAIHNRLVDVGLKLQRPKAVLNVSATSSAGAERAKRVCSKRSRGQLGQARNDISEIVGCPA